MTDAVPRPAAGEAPATQSGERPLAIVTGASSGIGWAFAEHLASDGFDLAVVARRAERLEELKQRLEGAHGVMVQPVVADLSTEAGMEAVGEKAVDPRLATVIDNAALAHYMPFLELPDEKALELFSLNALAPLRLIRAALPGMVERGHGTLISIATNLVFSPTVQGSHLPQRTMYVATKSFLFALIRMLAAELQGTGVRFQVVCPPVVRTEFHTRQGLDMSSRPRLEPEEVVHAAMRGLELGETVCVPALEDLDKLEHRDQADRDLLAAGLGGELAARYQPS